MFKTLEVHQQKGEINTNLHLFTNFIVLPFYFLSENREVNS